MRRVFIAILVSALVSACLFAVPEEVFTTKEYSVNLAATVTAGNANVDPDEPGTDPSKPETDEHKGLAIKVGYAPLDSASQYTIGHHYNTGELKGLGQHNTENPLTVSLTPEFEGDNIGSIYFYVAASSDCDVSAGSSLSVKFDVTQNWEITEKLPDGVKNPKGTISLTSNGDGYSGNNDGLSSKNSNAEVGVTATAGSRTATENGSSFIYVGRVDATWEKSDVYAAGDYTATIQVTVSEGE